MAVRFNGTAGQYLGLGSGPSTSSFSICLRGTLRGDRNALSSFLTYELADGFSYLGLQFDGTGTQLQVNFNNATAALANLAVGDDFYCALTCSGAGTNTLIGYFARPTDSALTSGSVSVSSLGTTFNYLRLGDNAYSEPTDMSMEYVVIYDSVLTSSEVAQQWRSPSPIKAAWGFYPMTANNMADCLLDSSGNSRNLTQTGTPTVDAGPLFGGPILSGATAIDIGSTVARPRVALTF